MDPLSLPVAYNLRYITLPPSLFSFLHHMNSPWFMLNVKQMLLRINISYQSTQEGEQQFLKDWILLRYSGMAKFLDEAMAFILLPPLTSIETDNTS